MKELKLERVLSLTPDVCALLEEYYESVQVVMRDGTEAMQRLLDDPQSGMWVTSFGEVAAGCVVLKAGFPLADAGECKRLYVRSAFRRQGLAQALMGALETYARSVGLQWVYLDTNDAFRASVELYRSHGYTECTRYNDNPQATLFFRKQL